MSPIKINDRERSGGKCFSPTRLCTRIGALVIVLIVTGQALAQETPPASIKSPDSPAPAASKPESVAGDQLSVDQARLADRFKRLEEVMGRLAELSASSDPRRAKILREAIAQSREEDLNVRFESTVKLLEDERLSAASTNQQELQKELDGLLALLLKAERDKELTSQRERIKKYLKEVGRLIRLQKGIRARTEGGDELKELGEDQQRVAGDTCKLNGNIAETEIDEKKEKDETVSDDAKDSKNTEGKPGDENKNGDKPNDSKPKAGDKEKKGDSNPSNDSKPSEDSKSPDSDKPPKESKDEDKSPDGKAPENAKPGESKDGNSKPADSQNGKPSDPKPSEENPSESKPSDGKLSDGKPSQPQNAPGSPQQQGDSGEQNDEQEPPQPKDPAQRATERLRDAQQNMEDALKKLKETKRKGAADEQRKALQALEQAKAELERVLRQLREEEMERTLTQLAARFRKMLELQNQVYEGTIKLDKVPEAQRDHDDEIEAARLGRQESQIVAEADKALLLLHEEGSSVAFPEAIEQMRSDMRQIVERLASQKVETITQGLEQDVIAALEETVATLEKAMKDLEKKKTPPGQSPQAGEPAEPPLVDKLAELKMIRSLQVRILTRTQRYGQMIGGEQAETDDLLKALKDLAEREQRVYQATADLQQGRND